jgi:DNA repair protein RadD
VLTEGWDLPELEVCVLARPTLSVGLYLQMVGRVMRPVPGKAIARIHDHASCILRHGLPDAERDYSLQTDRAKSDRLKLPPIKTCKACFAIYSAAARVCPACGYENESAPRQIKEVTDGAVAVPLEQLQRAQGDRERYLDEQLRAARESGRKPGWAAWRYKERYGEWPPSAWWGRNRMPLSAERIAELNARFVEKFKGRV